MRVAASRSKQAESICRRIAGAGREQVVFVDHKGRLDCCDASTPRHQAMADSREYSRRIVGVFGASVCPAEILSAASGVAL